MPFQLKGGFYQGTPVFYRKIGDSILYFSVSMISVVHGTPVSDNKKLWAVTILAVVGVVGKTITNFFTDTNIETPPKSNP